jgi:hypothetical protein
MYRRVESTKFPNLVSLPTLGDGSCFLHAVVQGFYKPYQTSRFDDGTVLDKCALVRELRNDLARMLAEPAKEEFQPVGGGESSNGEESDNGATKPAKVTWYSILSRGQLTNLSKELHNVDDFPDLTLSGFTKHLLGNAPLGQEIHEYLSKILNIGIIIFTDGNIYSGGKEYDMYYKGKKYFVLVMNKANVHFETGGFIQQDGSVKTLFKNDDAEVKDILDTLV